MSRGSLLAVGVGLAIAGAVAIVLVVRQQRPEVVPSPDDPPVEVVGFRERGVESGLAFRMAFLPNEQGEKFKINLYDHGCGVAVGDYDGDGHEDVYFLNQLGSNGLFRNRGDGTFEDVTPKAGVGVGDRVCVAATFADYDNDGDADLYVTSTRGGNLLFRNEGNGTFTDATAKAGLTLVAHSQTAVFFDADNDGFLDLFVTNTAKWTLDGYDEKAHYFPGMPEFWQMAGSPKEFNVLYRNRGDGTFEDATAKAGLKGRGWGGDVAVFDYDRDGRLDLFVTNMFGANQLYRNRGDGTFVDVARDVLGRTSWGAIGCKAFDANTDGQLDLMIADMHSDMWLPSTVAPDPNLGPPYDFFKRFPNIMGPNYKIRPEAREAEDRLVGLFDIRYDDVVFGNTLFVRRPNGTFDERAETAGVETFWPWGIAAADFDGDGSEDVFLPSGMGYPYAYWPSALLMNDGRGAFADRAKTAGIDPPNGGIYLPERIGKKQATRSSRCAAVADFDGDGRPDLVVNNFNDRPFYFRNDFPKKRYIAFRLTGTRSNRDAIGAVVRLHIGNDVMIRQVHGAGGYLSQSSKTLLFGLGDRTKVDWAEVVWPSGIEQRIDAPALDRRHDLTEPKS